MTRGRNWHAEARSGVGLQLKNPSPNKRADLNGFHGPLWVSAGQELDESMFPQAHVVENIEGLKQDPIVTHCVLKERKNIIYFKVWVCVSGRLLFMQRTAHGGRGTGELLLIFMKPWIILYLHLTFLCTTQVVMHYWYYHWSHICSQMEPLSLLPTAMMSLCERHYQLPFTVVQITCRSGMSDMCDCWPMNT